MTGASLQNVLSKIITENPKTTFLVYGDTLRGDIRSYRFPDSAKFIFVRDCIAVETTMSELADVEHSEIVLVQYDCYVSQIWQLTMQAYIEQYRLSDHIKRICFRDDKCDFSVSRFDSIEIAGSYDAYCQLACKHIRTELSKYLIEAEAVECYLDLYSPTGRLRKYICEISAKFGSPYDAYGVFCRDYPLWGLEDSEFIMIAMETLYQDERYSEIVQKWKRILKVG